MKQGTGPDFGNGRDVRKFLDRVCARQANRLARGPEMDDPAAWFRIQLPDVEKL